MASAATGLKALWLYTVVGSYAAACALPQPLVALSKTTQQLIYMAKKMQLKNQRLSQQKHQATHQASRVSTFLATKANPRPLFAMPTLCSMCACSNVEARMVAALRCRLQQK